MVQSASSNPFDQFDAAQQRKVAPILGPPPTIDPAEAARLDISRAAELRQQRKDAIDLQNAPLERELKQAQLAKAKQELKGSSNTAATQQLANDEAIAAINRARELARNGWFTTGLGGQVTVGVGGSDARNLKTALNTVASNITLGKLAELKQASQTGASGLGSLTEKEGELLRDSIAGIDQFQGQEELLRSLDEIEQHYRKVLALQQGKDLADPNVQKEYGIVTPQSAGKSDIAPELQSLTVDNLADLATGLSGGKYEITEDGGLTYDGKPVAASDAILNSDAFRERYREKFGKYPPLQVDITGGATPPASELDKQRNTILGEIDAVGRGGADAVTLGWADELAAVADTVFGGGTMRENLLRERAVDAADQRVNPLVRFTGQALGGALLPIGRARTAKALGLKGAGYGGAYAFGSGEGSISDRLAEVPAGAVLGGAVGFGAGALGKALAARVNRGGPPTPPGGQEAIDIARAGQEEGVRLSRPIVDPSRRDAMAYLESSIGGNAPVRAALQGTVDDIESAAGRLGAEGAAQEGGMMGQRVQDAGDRYIERSRGVGRRLYDRAAQIAGNSRAEGREAVAALDEQIADLSRNANSNAPLIRYLQEIKSDFVDDAGNLVPKDIGAIRDLRTSLRGQISNRNLTATDAERRVGLVLDAAGRDIQRDLGQAAPAAVRQYQRADRFWRERKAEIDQVVRRVIGNNNDRLGGEQVWSRVRAMAGPNGDSTRLERLWSKLDPEEQSDAAATIAASLGRKSPEEEFSPAQFVTSVRALSPSARKVIFGPEGAKSINNLRLLSEAYRDTAARLNNSRSGMVQNWNQFLNSVTKYSPTVGGIGGGAVGGLPGAAVGAVAGSVATGSLALARRLSARALMSPDMTRWLAQAPRATTPQRIANHIGALSRVAARDPAIAQDALGLQRALEQAFAQAPLRSAAREKERD